MANGMGGGGFDLSKMLMIANLAATDPQAAARLGAATGQSPGALMQQFQQSVPQGGGQSPIGGPIGRVSTGGQDQMATAGMQQPQQQQGANPAAGLAAALAAVQPTQQMGPPPAPGPVAPSGGRAVDPSSIQAIMQLLQGSTGQAPVGGASLGRLIRGG